MRIIRVCGSYFPSKKMGGAVTIDYDIDSSLQSKGYDVQVMTTNAGLGSAYKNKSEIFNKIRVFYYSFLGPKNYSLSFKFIYDLYFNIKNKKADIFWFSGSWNLPNVLGCWFCRLFNVKYIITPHGSISPGLIKNKNNILKKILVYLFVKKNFIHAEHIHCTVKNEKDNCLSIFGHSNNYQVIPLGLNFNNFPNVSEHDILSFREKFNVNTGEHWILFLGRLNWIKGIDVLAKALELANREMDIKARILCVGPDDDDYIHKLKNTLSDEEFSQLYFTGYLEGAEMHTAFKVADLFALTSISENFGLSVIEASYYSLPVLLTHGVGVSCFYTDRESGLLSNYDTLEIKKNIVDFFSDPILAESLMYNGKNLTSEFTIEKYMQRVESKLLGVK